MNIKFYKKLLSFRSHSKSRKQLEFRDWLEAYITVEFPGVTTEIDDYGNLYVTKNTSEQRYYNCVVAHLDINQKVITDDFSILVINNYIVGINNVDGKQIGLGHDDKVGVYFALQALKKFDNIKCFFPLDEEVGLLGTKASEEDFFNDVGFFLQLDRRGYYDISQFTNGHATVTYDTKKEFEKLLCKYNFHWTNTVSTDVGALIQRHFTQGVNISCGYNNEHTNDEILHVLRYDNSEKFAMELLKLTNNKFYYMDITTTYNKPVAKTVTSGYTRGYSNSSNTSNQNLQSNTTPTLKKEVASSKDEKKNNGYPSIFEEGKSITQLETLEDELEYSIEMLLDLDITSLKEYNEFRKIVADIQSELKKVQDEHLRNTLVYRLYTNVCSVNDTYSLSPYRNLGTLHDLEKDLETDWLKAQEDYNT